MHQSTIEFRHFPSLCILSPNQQAVAATIVACLKHISTDGEEGRR